MAEGERRIAMAAQFDLLRGPGLVPTAGQQQQQQLQQQQMVAQQQQNQRQALSGFGIGMGMGMVSAQGGEGTPRVQQGAPLTRSHSHGGFHPLRRSSATTMDEYFSNIEEGNDNEDEGLFF